MSVHPIQKFGMTVVIFTCFLIIKYLKISKKSERSIRWIFDFGIQKVHRKHTEEYKMFWYISAYRKFKHVRIMPLNSTSLMSVHFYSSPGSVVRKLKLGIFMSKFGAFIKKK